MRDIGKNIRDLRERNNLTQEELAGKLYVTRQTVSNYETGKSRPDVDMILKIADIMDVDANTVFYGIPLPESKQNAYRRMIITSVILLSLAIIGIPLHLWSETLSIKKYMLTPKLTINLLFDTVVLLILGWWFMQGVHLLLNIKSLKKPWTGKAGWGLIIFTVTFFILCIPCIVFSGIGDVKRTVTGSVNMSAPYIPVYSEISYFLVRFNGEYKIIYAIIGGVLWLFGFPDSQRVKRKEPLKT